MGLRKLAVALAFFGLALVLPAEKAEATCYLCGLFIVVDMSGNPIGTSEECYETYRLFAYKNCWHNSIGQCWVGGETCRYA